MGTDAALAVYPTGTANLFASAMKFTDDPAALVEVVRGGDRRTIDTGTCNGLTFNIMAGTGFDAAMIDSADDDKERLGMVVYVRAGVNRRVREAYDMRVEIDGERVFEGSASCLLVANIGTLKGGMEAFPDASPTDGILDVAVVTAAGLKAWTGLMVSAVRGRQHLSGHAHMWSGRRSRFAPTRSTVSSSTVVSRAHRRSSNSRSPRAPSPCARRTDVERVAVSGASRRRVDACQQWLVRRPLACWPSSRTTGARDSPSARPTLSGASAVLPLLTAATVHETVLPSIVDR